MAVVKRALCIAAWLPLFASTIGCFTTPDRPDAPDDATSDVGSSCPAEYTTQPASSTSRYRIVGFLTTWTAAQTDCANDSSMITHLIVIEDDVERREISGTTTESLWIGLADTRTEGVYRWIIDGGPRSADGQ